MQPSPLAASDSLFAAVYADYLLLSGVADPGGRPVPEERSTREIDLLLERHGLPPREFGKLVERYRSRPELWRVVLDEVRSKLKKRQS